MVSFKDEKEVGRKEEKGRDKERVDVNYINTGCWLLVISQPEQVSKQAEEVDNDCGEKSSCGSEKDDRSSLNKETLLVESIRPLILIFH